MRVLLIDDDDDLTAMMAEYLGAEGLVCERTSDPIAGLQLALTGQFDALVLDVMMPELDGVELLRRLRHASSLPVLMLTAKGDGTDRVLGLELGADDYVSKPFYFPELVARLRAILRRARAPLQADQEQLRVGSLRIWPPRRQTWLNDRPIVLTGTEFEILLRLAQRANDVVSKDELSELALRRRRGRYDRSVDVHVSKVRQKLNAAGGGIEIETMRAVGYRLRALE